MPLKSVTGVEKKSDLLIKLKTNYISFILTLYNNSTSVINYL